MRLCGDFASKIVAQTIDENEGMSNETSECAG